MYWTKAKPISKRLCYKKLRYVIAKFARLTIYNSFMEEVQKENQC